jgi:hypothetical protein
VPPDGLWRDNAILAARPQSGAMDPEALDRFGAGAKIMYNQT